MLEGGVTRHWQSRGDAIEDLARGDAVMDSRDKKVAKSWDEQSSHTPAARTRWWQFPTIHRHINRRVCGEPIDGFSQGLLRRLQKVRPGETYERGVSVGCGSGQKEMTLIRQGVVKSFELFEFSPVRIERENARAEELGISDRVTFRQANAFEVCHEASFDFVHWNNSLHHMYDVDAAIAWSRRVLRKGGVFYMDDFVGAKRFQWSRSSLLVASLVRSLLPARYLVDPRDQSKTLARRMQRPDPERLAADDPSEAADSDRILPMIHRHFPDAEIVLTGGAIYHLTLSDVLANVDEERDRTLLTWLLRLDSLMTTLGETHYAVAFAFT